MAEVLGAGMAVAPWLRYWEQGWLWHRGLATGSRDGCGTVAEVLGAGIAVALWLRYWEQG